MGGAFSLGEDTFYIVPCLRTLGMCEQFVRCALFPELTIEEEETVIGDATCLDRTLTLAKALSPRGPSANV